MKFWNFDPELANVVDAAGNWHRDTGKAADYTDIVLAARRYSLVDTPMEAQLPALNDMPVFTKLGLGDANDEGRIELLQEAEGEINGIKAMLNA
jgi:HD-like signal output (HDOD) protein